MELSIPCYSIFGTTVAIATVIRDLARPIWPVGLRCYIYYRFSHANIPLRWLVVRFLQFWQNYREGDPISLSGIANFKNIGAFTTLGAMSARLIFLIDMLLTNSRTTYPQVVPPWQSGPGICWNLSSPGAIKQGVHALKSEVFCNLCSGNNTFHFLESQQFSEKASISKNYCQTLCYPICHIQCKAAEQVVLRTTCLLLQCCYSTWL